MEKRGIPRLFNSALKRVFLRCSRLYYPVDKSVVNESPIARARQALRATPSNYALPRAPRRAIEQVSVGDDRGSAFPDAGNARPAGRGSIRQRPDSRPGETRDTLKPPSLPLPGPRSSGASSRRPQWARRPVSANIGGGRNGSPSGRSLGHSSIGSASRSTRPPRAHPLVERNQILGRLGERLRHQQQPALCELRRVGDADRHHPIAFLQRLHRRRAVLLKREIVAEHQRQAGEQKQAGRSLAAAAGAAPAIADGVAASASAATSDARSQQKKRAPARAGHFFVRAVVVRRLGRAGRHTDLGERLARLVGGGLLRRIHRLVMARSNDDRAEQDERGRRKPAR